MCNSFAIDFTKSEVKMLLKLLDKHSENHIFGSPKEQEIYDTIYRKLKIALLDLTFLDER